MELKECCSQSNHCNTTIYTMKIDSGFRDYIQSIWWLYDKNCRNIADCIFYNIDYTLYSEELKELLCTKRYITWLISSMLQKNNPELSPDVLWKIDFAESEVIVYGL